MGERETGRETEGFCTASRRPTAPPAGVLIIAHQIPRTPSFLWLTICLRNNLDEQRFILTSSFRDFSPRSLWTLSEAKYHGRGFIPVKGKPNSALPKTSWCGFCLWGNLPLPFSTPYSHLHWVKCTQLPINPNSLCQLKVPILLTTI